MEIGDMIRMKTTNTIYKITEIVKNDDGSIAYARGYLTNTYGERIKDYPTTIAGDMLDIFVIL